MRIFTIIVFLLFYSCSTKVNKQDVPKRNKVTTSLSTDSVAVEEDIDAGIAKPEYITGPDEKSIISANDTLYLGDTLKLKFKTPHPKDLAIYAPDDKFFFIVYASFESEIPPLIDYQKFAQLDSLNIVTTETKGNPWMADVKEAQLIFTKAGLYRILLSENLETDDGTPIEEQYVFYTGKPRNN